MASSQAGYRTVPGRRRRLVTVGVVVVTFVAGTLLVVGSDPVADVVTQARSTARWVAELGLGVLFVAITTLVLWLSTRGRAQRLDTADERTDDADARTDDETGQLAASEDRVHAAGGTDVGQVRQNNQDSFHVGGSVFAVADGVGGHLAGEVASEDALEPVKELDGRVFPDGETAVQALEDAVVDANRLVSTKAASDASFRGMGTTLTVAMFEGQRLHIAHVGDSRAYLLRDGVLTQVTTDHSLVQHLIDAGQITPEEAATHPQRAVVTRAIGVSRDVEVDAMTLDICDGDELLLCSDGLSGLVSDGDVAAVLPEDAPAERTIETLIAKANDAGGSDNITGVLLRFGRG